MGPRKIRRPISAGQALLSASFAVQLVLAGCAAKIDPNHPEVGLQAMAARDPNASVVLGLLYMTGTKVPQDFNQARTLFQSAADRGNPGGQFQLALLYESGKGVPRDLNQTKQLLEAASAQGFAPAITELGAMYFRGNGVAKDEAKGRAMIHEAAVKGFAGAQFLFGLMVEAGQVPEGDDSVAYQWASLAASKLTGVPSQAAQRVRTTAEKGLTPEDIVAAQTATAKWTPGMDIVSVIPPGSPPRPPRIRSQGSGFIIGRKGEIATDFHVVPKCTEIRVKDSAGKMNVVTHILADDRTNDLAVLAPGGFGNHLKLDAVAPSLGETIVTYGYPLGPMLSSTGNMTTGTVSGTTGIAGNLKSYQITAPVQPGSSGGPVVDENGSVRGIVASKLNALAMATATGDIAQNVNFAWRADALQSLLSERGIAFDSARGKGSALSTGDLVNLLQNATVKVECWR